MPLTHNEIPKNLNRFLLAIVTTTLVCCSNLNAQIVTIGDLNHTYNGTDDPWNIPTFFTVGNTAEGILLVFGGSVVNSPFNTIGQNSGVIGEATISGAGSQWNHTSGSSSVGSLGEGILNIDMGGVVTGFRIEVARNANGAGTINVTNASQLTLTDDFRLGLNGPASVNVESGSTVSSRNGTVGNEPSATSTVTITGASTWNNSADLSVGVSGPGILLVEDGSVANSEDGFVGGFNFSGNGNATVTGVGSQWNNTTNMTVGRRGEAVLEVSEGGHVTSLRSIIGDQVDGSGIATVTGAGSRWNSSSDFFVGGNSIDPGGSGTLNIEDGGSVLVETTMKIWDSGTVNLDGGNLDVFRLDLTQPAASDNFNMLPGSRLTLRNEVLGPLKQDGGTIALESFTPVDFSDDYTMNAGRFSFDIGGTFRGFQYDAIDVIGLATINGGIDINLVDGFIPTTGTSFQLIDADGGYAGTPIFDVCDAALGPGQTWDTSTFLIDGTITVAAGTPDIVIGDMNLDCNVNLLDISLFIDRLSTGTFQAEADTNEDGLVNLLDIGPFISILSSQ